MDGVTVYYADRETGKILYVGRGKFLTIGWGVCLLCSQGNWGNFWGFGRHNRARARKQGQGQANRALKHESEGSCLRLCSGWLCRLSEAISARKKVDAGRPAPKLGRGMYLRVVSTASWSSKVSVLGKNVSGMPAAVMCDSPGTHCHLAVAVLAFLTPLRKHSTPISQTRNLPQ